MWGERTNVRNYPRNYPKGLQQFDNKRAEGSVLKSLHIKSAWIRLLRGPSLHPHDLRLHGLFCILSLHFLLVLLPRLGGHA